MHYLVSHLSTHEHNVRFFFLSLPPTPLQISQHLNKPGILNKDMLKFVFILAQQHKISAFQPAAFSNCFSVIRKLFPLKSTPYPNLPMAEDIEYQPGNNPPVNNGWSTPTSSLTHPIDTADQKSKSNNNS